jgi:sporulation protein YlmC with PRC-barrel domain
MTQGVASGNGIRIAEFDGRHAMVHVDTAALSRLADSGETIANGDEDVRGRDVLDKDGEQIGKVEGLLIDNQERKVRFLIVEHGGFLGFGQTKSFIPVDAVTRITADEVCIDQHGAHVAGAPAYDPDLAVPNRPYFGGLFGYYGYLPYWDGGYQKPGYPYSYGEDDSHHQQAE